MTYLAGSSTIDCDLSDASIDECPVTVSIQVNSINGTVAIQYQSELVVRTECLNLENFVINQSSYWLSSSASPSQLDPTLLAGYEIRDSVASFELPFLDVQLPSQDDVIAMCGSLVYQVDLVGRAITDYPDFIVTLTDPSLKTSAQVSLESQDQSYALDNPTFVFKDGYLFKISAYHEYHQAFVFDFSTTAEFWVRDFCAGIQFVSPEPVVQKITDNFEVLLGSPSTLDQSMMVSMPGEAVDNPWIVSLTKNLGTQTSELLLLYTQYQKYFDQAAGDPQPPANTGCHLAGAQPLIYSIVSRSWNENDQVKNQMFGHSAKLDEYYLTAGVLYQIEATKREHIGLHHVTIEVKLEKVPISPKLYIRVQFEILDCVVESFESAQ